MRFFDASALAKLYVQEPESSAIRLRVKSDVAATSRLSEVEVASAIANRVRAAAMPEVDRDRALATLTDDLAVMLIVELTGEVTRRARSLLQRQPIRAGDAIQLASCLDLQDRLGQPVEMVSFDKRLNEAAVAEGLSLPA